MHTAEAHRTMGKAKPVRSDLITDPDSGVLISRFGKDRGTPERGQHDEARIEGDETPHLRVTTAPLDRYYARQLLAPGDSHKDRHRNHVMFTAGDTLRADFYLSGLSQKVTVDLLSVGYGRGEMTDRQVGARQRYRKACLALDMELWACVREVVCGERSATDWAKGRGKRGRQAEIAGMTVLQLGLEALARHYGLLTAAERSV